MTGAAAVAREHGDASADPKECRPLWVRGSIPPEEPTAAAVRASVERGDYSLVVRDRPMRVRVDASECVGTPVRPVLAAATDEAVADDPNGTDLQLGVVEADSDGHDADAVEHNRQAMLARWQRLPVE